MKKGNRYPAAVRWWLYAGVLMIFFQVIIGGITRLTESGLSITEWEVVTGTLPPMNEKEWEDAFEKYRNTPQYKQLFEGMSLADFKYIYFWEYFHRLWARLIGFVFIIPFIVFSWKGWLDKKLLWRLLRLVLLGGLVASFGWIMVASGLEERPWVDAYKLTGHLLLGCALFAYMSWIALDADYDLGLNKNNRSAMYRYLQIFLVLFIIQLSLGGLMSGMKAGLYFPTWPEMNGAWIPSVLTDGSEWKFQHIKDYDHSLFMPALVQFLHRSVAYILFFLGLWIVYKKWNKGSNALNTWLKLLGILLISQLVVGIITVLLSKGEIPVFWGVLHQGIALLLLLCLTACFYFSLHRDPSLLRKSK